MTWRPALPLLLLAAVALAVPRAHVHRAREREDARGGAEVCGCQRFDCSPADPVGTINRESGAGLKTRSGFRTRSECVRWQEDETPVLPGFPALLTLCSLLAPVTNEGKRRPKERMPVAEGDLLSGGVH
jgi:hypothetical protein